MSQKIWKNWARNVECTPTALLHPSTEQEIIDILQRARQEGRRLRMVGSGHSFTPLAQTNDYLVTLQNMQGLIHLDKAKKQARVWAGTTINALGKLLHTEGLAQQNLGDIDKQSIAGATSTGTHGTGVQFGGISTQIVALRFISAAGELIECSGEDKPEIFNAARVALGALGIVTQITLQLQDSYKLDYRTDKASLEDTLQNLEKYKTENRNFEFYWFPYTDTVQLKFSNETQQAVKDSGFKKFINQSVLENGVFGLICRFGRTFSGNYRRINRLLAGFIGKEQRINYSHLIYASPRNVRFKEMEYNVPEAHFPALVRAIRAKMEEKQYRVFFPLECRWTRADEIWLSPSNGRNSAYIAFHVYEGTAHEEYFRDMEELCMQYDGRPHWGKMHTRSADNLATTYAHWADFLALRQQLDPDKLLINPYLERVFGV